MKANCKRFSLLLALLASAIPAVASVPAVINYQGRLTQPSGTPVADGTYSMLFSIYAAPTGGTALWSETNAAVQLKGGLFATMLGSVSSIPANIFDSPTRYFAVKVGSDAEMTPRQQIASVGYAVKAASADIATTVPDAAITGAKLATSAVLLGYAQTTTAFNNASSSSVQVPGLTTTVTVPAGGRKVKVTVWCYAMQCPGSTNVGNAIMTLWDTQVGSPGTKIAEAYASGSDTLANSASIIAVLSPNAGSKTYCVSIRNPNTSPQSVTYNAIPGSPGLLLVESL